MTEHMTPDLAARLRRFVADGGTVIAESPFAFRDGEGRLQYSAPAFGLDEVFGCETHDRERRETAPPIHCPSGATAVHLFWNEYDLCGGEALATYASGTAAVVRHRFGKGTAILAGTEVFRQYVQNSQPAMTALLRAEISASGVQPTARLSGQTDAIEISRLSGEGGLLYVIINHNDTERRFRVELQDRAERWTDLTTDQPVDFATDLALAGRGVLAVVPANGRT
jgi:hypothetical protein